MSKNKHKSTSLVAALVELLKVSLAKKQTITDVIFKSDHYKRTAAKKKPSECILVIDLASTCWASHEEQTAKNPKQTHEILEIAITPITIKDLSIGETSSYIIKPRQKHAVSELCTHITGITPEMAADGEDIEVVFKAIKEKYKKANALMIASFGLYDIKMIKYQCDKLELDYPFPGGFMDLNRTCAMMLGISQGNSLGTMMQEAGIKFDQRLQKRAGLDSRRAAKLIAKLWGMTRPKKEIEKISVVEQADAIVPDKIVVLN